MPKQIDIIGGVKVTTNKKGTETLSVCVKDCTIANGKIIYEDEKIIKISSNKTLHIGDVVSYFKGDGDYDNGKHIFSEKKMGSLWVVIQPVVKRGMTHYGVIKKIVRTQRFSHKMGEINKQIAHCAENCHNDKISCIKCADKKLSVSFNNL